MIFTSAWNTTFTEHGKVLVLKFPEMGNTVFFLIEKIDVRWYFLQHGIPCSLITEKFLFLTFRIFGNTVFFDPKS